MNQWINDEKRFEYHIYELQFCARKLTGTVDCVFIRKGRCFDTHNVLIHGEKGKLSILIKPSDGLSIPSLPNMKTRRQWFIALPQKYDIHQFVYRIIQAPSCSVRPLAVKPVKTFFDISPVEMNKIKKTHRKNVKFLLQTLTLDVKRGNIRFQDAATRYTVCTGCDINTSLRYFSFVYFERLSSGV
ncbi:hypothetical protein HVW19_26750 (plasmid) [Escherichia coli]|uniref:hypothetical protein n=1 Tax=Escherichia coli TaxID=562 RepID=UPI000CFB6D14|nr:hypothetical protein [Escherichia coli]MBA8484683.1 hypothetical protein [Escherichia coli]